MTRGDAELALQWFEERASRVPMPGARIMYRLAAEALREQVEREKNEPLTLEELREMSGEPVWAVLLEPTTGTKAGWALTYSNGGYAAVQRWTMEVLGYHKYGKTWLAYRRKLEEVAE